MICISSWELLSSLMQLSALCRLCVFVPMTELCQVWGVVLIIDAAVSTVPSLCVCAVDRTVPSVRCCSHHWCSCQHCAISVCLCRWQNCAKCEVLFDEKLQIHHCRACGRGFCESCSSHRRPVPERNWGMEPVRVCDVCYESPPRRLSGISPLQLFWPKDKDMATVAMEL